MNTVAWWRIAAGILVLVAFLAIIAVLTPVYFHNLQLQSFVADLTHSASVGTTPDDNLRASVLAKARALNLPVLADDVHILHSTEGLRIDVRYFVTVNLPGYTVGLHFNPHAKAR